MCRFPLTCGESHYISFLKTVITMAMRCPCYTLGCWHKRVYLWWPTLQKPAPSHQPQWSTLMSGVGLLGLKPHLLPVLQLGIVRKPWQPKCFLAHSFKAFSDARKFVVDRVAIDSVRELPTWHCVVFRNKHHRAYVAPRFVRKGALMIEELMDH